MQEGLRVDKGREGNKERKEGKKNKHFLKLEIWSKLKEALSVSTLCAPVFIFVHLAAQLF